MSPAEATVTVAGIGAVVAVYGTTLPLLISARKHSKAAAKDAKEARDQTANDHGTNLRDDLDHLAQTVRNGFATQARYNRATRAELRAHVNTTSAAAERAELAVATPIERGRLIKRRRQA
jgi:hypothetical protein